MSSKPVYKTWIRKRLLIIFLVISVCLLAVAFTPINMYLRIFSGLLALPFCYITFIVSRTSYQFSPIGNNFQSMIHDLIIDQLKWDGDGKLLDIGTGSGSLIIKGAKAFPKGQFVGIDYWGSNWEYSQKLCERNAEIEGVSDRVSFIKASASKLPFLDNTFHAMVSCLTFHEVKDEKNKIKLLKEAFRVLDSDGVFVLMDLFMDNKTYGNYSDFLPEVKKFGVSELEAIQLSDLIKLPHVLRSKKSLGNAVLLIGRKGSS
ncbi:class I SAM-dependent methyltransferase [Sporolactobacillus shoreicorticis]|uniref:Class I SAM-dependent methyltransferase n=1 Tax=Sporolactobacillus shoreicorticis TaxID=1923877 RepID=A0ABW5S3D7_9BACL|nr:class I SAM-dependent methyltransferase [Sporolactobacillus shoreicorticis]MCO7125425.1 class I SAM-dependent methyltransferase [Sporolactobacillus shoreicorticis]